MGQEFLTFLDDVQALALERLNIAAEEALASTEFTPGEILAQFNELVTDPLILVAGLQQIAALKLAEAAEMLMGQTASNFNISTNSSGDPVGGTHPGPTIEEIKEAMRMGVSAGTKAMSQAAIDLARAVIVSASSGQDSSEAIALALAQLPSSIVVNVVPSEFD